jgi:hypothetical protein
MSDADLFVPIRGDKSKAEAMTNSRKNKTTAAEKHRLCP